VSLSRKRKKELKRLKGEANELWHAQQEILDHANHVAREASRQLGAYGREQVVPSVVSTYEHKVQPVVDRGYAASRGVVEGARRGLDKTVFPVLGGVVGSVLSIGDIAKDHRVRAALERFQPKPPPKKTSNVGGVIAVGAGVLAAAGVAYAVWQTFRADDELWVADEEPALPNL
jgi:hypothetical protein